jgi:demethylmenaquinone methyltransferase/2-methoxy-6-polyprenyl-1,4-benzoquinol methylase
MSRAGRSPRVAPPPTPKGDATERGNAAAPSEVGAMFDRISRVYDPMNLVISGFQEPRWRRRAVALAALGPGGRAIDVATGTGKVAADLARATQPGGEVLGVDLSPGMIGVARRRHASQPGLAWVVGDALALPAEDGRFDAATIAFGMRNLPDYERGFAEMARVVRPGGRVVCLEIARPRSRLARVLSWWFDQVVPVIGRLVGQGAAYAYLVSSVRSYPPPDRIAEIMRAVGLADVRWSGMSGGIVTLHVGTVPAGPRAEASAAASVPSLSTRATGSSDDPGSARGSAGSG